MEDGGIHSGRHLGPGTVCLQSPVKLLLGKGNLPSQQAGESGKQPLQANGFCHLGQAAAAQGIPCKLSYTAGAYVCNDLFYRLLHQYRGTGVLVDFIHVPFLPEQAKNGEPSMALADMARALEALILALEP